MAKPIAQMMIADCEYDTLEEVLYHICDRECGVMTDGILYPYDPAQRIVDIEYAKEVIHHSNRKSAVIWRAVETEVRSAMLAISRRPGGSIDPR
jgi:hypothetical protein